MAEKLSITIFLDGAAEIERQLEGIGQAGTKAFDAIGTAAEKAGGFDKLDPKDVTAKLEQFGLKGKAAIDKITAAVAQAGRLERIVGGVQKVEAGFASIGTAASAMSQRVTGAFTAITTAATSTGGAVGRVARSLGLLGSGAIVGSLGAAALAMEKAADSARVLEGNLQALFRNAQAGSQFFNQIQNAAQSAGSSLQGTAKAMLDITNAFRAASQARGFRFAPGEELKQAAKDAAQLFEILQQGMKLSGTRADEANKAISALFNEISKSGQVSGDTLRKLQAQFPQLGNALAKALGAPGQSLDQLADRIDKGLARIDFNKFTRAVKSIGPAIQEMSDAFDPTLAQRMDTIAGAWDRLLNSFGKSPSGAAIKAAMDDIAKGLDEIAKKQEQVGKFTVEKPPETAIGKFFIDEIQAWNDNIIIAQKNWDHLVRSVTQPIKNIGLMLPDKITVPFEADPEPPWVQAYLGFIEKIKIAFNSMFTPDVAAADAAEPAWVQAYLGFIDRIKTAFSSIFTPSVAAEGTPEPAWVQAYLGAIQRIKDAIASISWNTITDAGVAAWDAVTSAIGRAIAAIQRFLGLRGGGAAPAPAGAAGGQFASGGLLRGRGTGTSDSNLAWVSRGEYIVPARVVRQPGVLAFLEALRGTGRSRLKNGLPAYQEGGSVGIGEQVSAGIDRIIEQLNRSILSLNNFTSVIQNNENQMIISLGRMINSFAQSVQNMQLTIASGSDTLREQTVAIAESVRNAALALRQLQNDIGGRASGGLLGGRGTGTSDSNLVRVSRGEYIIPARAVRQPGVLAFLEALRRSGGSLRDVLDDMGRFALGGLVPRTLPAFAAGSLADMAGGRQPIALTINAGGDRQTFHLWADEQVADSVLRYATKRQVASAGRKSGAFG